MKLKCKKCGKGYIAWGQRIKTAKYCSSRCYGDNKKGIKIEHLRNHQFKKGCKINVGRKRPDVILRNLHNNPMWKKSQKIQKKPYSTINKEGYIFVYKPKHPFSNYSGYVREHRLVMEKAIGRYLKPKEAVHHKDLDKTNNKIENLKLFKSNSEHMKFHVFAQRWALKNYREIITKEAEDGKHI